MAKLFLDSQRIGAPVPNEIIYDEFGNHDVHVKFLTDDQLEDAFSLPANTPVLGKYDVGTAAWQLFGPDGPPIDLLGEGSIADPKVFIPNNPGRWLVRLHVQEWVWDDVNQQTILATEATKFTALFEVQDPNVLGHYAARPYLSGTITQGTSPLAANETNEYDEDEGWARGIERYLSTTSKQLGFRRILTGEHAGVGNYPAGSIVTLSSDSLNQWKDCDADRDNYQNFSVRFEAINGLNADVKEAPLLILLHDCPQTESNANGQPQAGRVYALLDGILAWDTSAWNVGDRIYVDDLGEVSNVNGTVERHIGEVLRVSTDSATNPGVIYFHGHTTFFPGVVHGPAVSTDQHLVRWDGVTGELIQDSIVKLAEPGGTRASFETPGGEPIRLSPGGVMEGLFLKDDGSGNPNIGINTAIPTAFLHIDITNINNQPAFKISQDNDKRFEMEADFSDAGNDYDPLHFKSADFTSLMTFYTNTLQRVGVGTTTPQTTFHIRQGVAEPTILRVEANADHSPLRSAKAEIKTNDPVEGGPTVTSGLTFIDNSNVEGASIDYSLNWSGGGFLHDTNELGFKIANGVMGGGTHEVLRIMYNGVAIGLPVSTPPTHLLHVQGGSAKIDDDLLVGSNATVSTGDLTVSQGSIGVTNGRILVTNPLSESAFGGMSQAGKALTVTGDLKVTGIIDPIGLIFDPIDTAGVPATGPGTPNWPLPMGVNQGGFFISDGMYAGAPNAGRPYFCDQNGVITEFASGASALTIPGPGVNTSTDQAVVTWNGSTGDSIQNTELLVGANGPSSISTPDTAPGIDSNELKINTGAVFNPGFDSSGRILISTPHTDAGKAGDLEIVLGDSGVAGAAAPQPPGSLLSTSGASHVTGIGAGNVTIRAGYHHGLDAIDKGGPLILHGGDGGRGGRTEIRAGNVSNDGLGHGGNLILHSGHAGDQNAPGFGNPPVIDGGIAGGVEITAADAGKNTGAPIGVWPSPFGGGGKVKIISGAGAGEGSAGDIDLLAGAGTVYDAAFVNPDKGGSKPGDVFISAGRGGTRNVAPLDTKISGGSIKLEAGNAGFDTLGDGGTIKIDSGEANGIWVPGLLGMGAAGNVIINGNAPGFTMFGVDDPGRALLVGTQVPMACGPAPFRWPIMCINGLLKVTAGFDPTHIQWSGTTDNPAQKEVEEQHAGWANNAGQAAYDAWILDNAVDPENPTASEIEQASTVREEAIFNYDTLVGYGTLADAINDSPETFGYTEEDVPLTAEQVRQADIDGVAKTVWMEKATGLLKLGDTEIAQAASGGDVSPVVNVSNTEDTAVDNLLGTHVDVPYGAKYVNVDCTNGNVILNLPVPTSMGAPFGGEGYTFTVKDSLGQANASEGTGVIYIRPPDGRSLDQWTYEEPFVLNVPWAAAIIYSDGINWFIG